jgi:hypothetical protein
MRFLNLIIGLVLAQGFLWPIDPGQAAGLDSTEQSESAKTTAWRIQANPYAIFQQRGQPLSASELIARVREVLIADKSALQPVIAAVALATTEEKVAIGSGLGQAMLAVVSGDPSYATDMLSALAAKTDRITMAAFVAAARDLVREPASMDTNAGSAGQGNLGIAPGDNAPTGSIGIVASTPAGAPRAPVTVALSSAQGDRKPAAPEDVHTRDHSTEAVRPIDAVQPAELAQSAESIKPAGIGQPTAAANPAAAPQPTEPIKQVEMAHPTDAVKSAETSQPTQATQPDEIASPPAVKLIEPPRLSDAVKPVEMARLAETDPRGGTANAAAVETTWIVSETTSPIDYSPLVSATIWPRQQVNSGLSGFTISCRAKRIELSLRLMGDLDVPRWGELRIDTQIGDQRPVKQRWRWDEQQGTILFYEGDPAALLQSIPDGARLRLGVGDNKGARHMATYQFFGLDAVRKKVASACALPSSSTQASAEKR